MIGRLLSAFATVADAPLMQDQKQIDALYRQHRWRVLLAITLGYGLIYTCRLAIGLAKPSMIDAGIFTPAEFGLIGSALFYTYALGKLTNGFLADHANVRVFLPFGFIVSAFCNFGMGFADGTNRGPPAQGVQTPLRAGMNLFFMNFISRAALPKASV